MALIVGGLILFGSGAFAKEKIYFETYFADSVHGLGRGSAVQLNGVDIGVVEEVTFVLKSYDLPESQEGVSKYDQYIRVIFSAIEEELPRYETEGSERRLTIYLKEGLRLRLASNLITGQAYLEALFLDPERFPAMEVPWKPKFTYIPSAPGAFRSMQNSVDRILDKLQQIDFETVVDNVNTLLENLNKAILDANVEGLSAKARQLLADADKTVKSLGEKVQKLVVDADQALIDANLRALSEKAQQLMLDADQALIDADLKALSAKVRQFVADADKAVVDANVKELSTVANAFIDELRQSNQDLKKLLESPDPKEELANIPVLVDKFNQTLSQLDQLIVSQTPEVREIIENIRQLSENLNYLTERLKDNPSELLFSAPPPKQEK
ncbi:MAG: hypothetical protein ACYTBJ_19590 [Planctomycetota bacterium]